MDHCINDEEHDWKLADNILPKEELFMFYKYISVPVMCSKCKRDAIGLYRLVLADLSIDDYDEQD